MQKREYVPVFFREFLPFLRFYLKLLWNISVPTVSIDDGMNDSNKLREIIESEVFSEVFKQRKYPEMTFDEDMCVICNDNRTDNPALEFAVFMPCRHSVVCHACSNQGNFVNCSMCRTTVKQIIREKESPKWTLSAIGQRFDCRKDFNKSKMCDDVLGIFSAANVSNDQH